MPDAAAVDLRDFVAFDPAHAVRSRIFVTDLMAIDLLCLEPGQQLGARTHDESDIVYAVVGGRAYVATDDSEVALTPLQAVLIPAGTPHGVRNDSADPLLLQTISSPPTATAAADA